MISYLAKPILNQVHVHESAVESTNNEDVTRRKIMENCTITSFIFVFFIKMIKINLCLKIISGDDLEKIKLWLQGADTYSEKNCSKIFVTCCFSLNK